MSTNEPKEEKTITIDLERECPKYKEIYNACFQKWYQDEFLAGKSIYNVCLEEFKDYKACMIVSVRDKELQVFLEKDFRKEAQEEDWGIKEIRSTPKNPPL
jgi:TRIAP1/MDM35 family protein